MSLDPRCCDTGTCIIDAEGRCWCGQQWNGEEMAFAPPMPADSSGPIGPVPAPDPRTGIES